MLIHTTHVRLPAAGRRREARGAARHEAPGTARPSRFVVVRRSRRQDADTARVLHSLISPLR
jgi:hypothetical protein